MTNRGTQRGFGRREGQPFVNREHRTDIPNSITAYSITPDDRLVACIGTSALQPVYTLPPAALFRKGAILTIWDDANVVNPYGTFVISIKVQTNPYANDTIEKGTVPIVITAPGGFVELTSDGISNWQIINQSQDIQVFLASGTWTKRPGYSKTHVWMVGGGGGGGSGTSGASGSSAGGGGGGAGGIFEMWFSTKDLNATEAIVGSSTHAAGGAGKNAAVGAVGTAGQIWSFKSSDSVKGFIAPGGSAGPAGGTVDGGQAGAVNGMPWNGLQGGAGKATGVNGQAGAGGVAGDHRGLTTYSPGGGGGGGSGSALPTAGGAGGAGFNGGTTTAPAGSAGGNPSVAPTDSTDLAGGSMGTGDGGAGSGGSNNVGTGGRGGNGAFPGGGGGGSGGAVSTSGITGAGGTGGPGVCIVTSYQ